MRRVELQELPVMLAAYLEEEGVLSASFGLEFCLALFVRGGGLLAQPVRQDVGVVDLSKEILECLQQAGSLGVVSPDGVAQLRGVTQLPCSDAKPVKGVRFEAIVEAFDGCQQGCAPRLSSLTEAKKNREDLLSPPGDHCPQVPPKPRDVQIQERFSHAVVAATPGRSKSAPKSHELRASGPVALNALLEQAQTHIQIPAHPRGASQILQDGPGASHAPSGGLAAQDRESDPQSSTHNPHLVNGLRLSSHGLGKATEEVADPVLQERSGAVR